MSTLTEPVPLREGGTKTYRRRRALWLPGDKPFPSNDGRLGTLRIVQERATRATDATDCDEYGVQLDSDPWPLGAVVFVVRNDTPPAAEGERRSEFYRVTVADGWADCTCTAAQTRNPVCKHRDMIRQLILSGAL